MYPLQQFAWYCLWYRLALRVVTAKVKTQRTILNEFFSSHFECWSKILIPLPGFLFFFLYTCGLCVTAAVPVPAVQHVLLYICFSWPFCLLSITHPWMTCMDKVPGGVHFLCTTNCQWCFSSIIGSACGLLCLLMGHAHQDVSCYSNGIDV